MHLAVTSRRSCAAPTGSTTPSKPATTAAGPPLLSSMPTPRRRSWPTRRRTPGATTRSTLCAATSSASRCPPPIRILIRVAPVAGTARRRWMSRPCTPWHRRPTSCTSAPRAATTPTSTRPSTPSSTTASGISVLSSSGDSGDEIANTGSRQVDWSASDPFVTAVGGTSLAVGRNTDYLFEQGWGTGRSNLVNVLWDPTTPSYLYGGGGTSQLFKQPNYQKKVVPNSISNYFGQGAHRAVPDVGMVGDPNTGFLVGQSQNFPGGSIHYSEYRIGGTSLSSPLFAGVVAVADQVNGDSLGFLNPKIYKLAGSGD